MTTITATAPADTHPTRTSAAVVTFGHLAWLAWAWGIGTVLWATIVLAASVFGDGDLDQSVWASVVGSWQTWVAFGAGIATTFTMLPIVVTMGATRTQFSHGATIGFTVLTTVTTAFLLAGYAIESVIYDRAGWPQDSPTEVFEIVGSSDLGRAALELWPTIGGAFVSGWLVGLGFYRGGPLRGILLIAPSLVPAVACAFLGASTLFGIDQAVGDGPGLALGFPLSVAILAAAVLIAGRATTSLAIRRR